MRYNVARLLREPTGSYRQYQLNQDIRHLEPEFEVLRPLVGSVHLLRTSQGILLTGKMDTAVRGTCRRCLESCDVEVDLSVEEVFYSDAGAGSVPAKEAPEPELDEALLIDDRHTLDLSEVVRQELLIATSLQGLCSPDCAGLCSRCGGNLDRGECQCDPDPIDPRWAALRALLNTGSNSEERRD